MAKKAAATEFNMSQAIREVLNDSPQVSSREAIEAILQKHPNAKINKNSFSVAFYTGRQKLGISVSGRRGKKASRQGKGRASNSALNMDTLQAAARFLSAAGGIDSALAAIKQVQAVQIK